MWHGLLFDEEFGAVICCMYILNKAVDQTCGFLIKVSQLYIFLSAKKKKESFVSPYREGIFALC